MSRFICKSNFRNYTHSSILKLSRKIHHVNFHFSGAQQWKFIGEKWKDDELYILEKILDDNIFRLTIAHKNDMYPNTSYLYSQERLNANDFLADMYWSTVPPEKEHMHLI